MTDEFIAWMDAKRLRAEDVGKRLHVSAQTIRNWRASEIPARRHAEIRKLMSEWDDACIDRIVLTPTPKQFDTWNRAANAEDLTIRQWATKGLDELAKDYDSTLRIRPETPEERWQRENSSKVAEEGK